MCVCEKKEAAEENTILGNLINEFLGAATVGKCQRIQQILHICSLLLLLLSARLSFVITATTPTHTDTQARTHTHSMAATVYKRLHSASIGGGGGVVSSLIASTTSPGTMGGSSPMLGHSQLTRSLERILEEAHFSGELILTNRKLKDFPKTGTKYSLTDTVIAGAYSTFNCAPPL